MSESPGMSASEAGRALVSRRWGNRGLDNAVATIVARQAQLTDAQRAELRELTETSTNDQA